MKAPTSSGRSFLFFFILNQLATCGNCAHPIAPTETNDDAKKESSSSGGVKGAESTTSSNLYNNNVDSVRKLRHHGKNGHHGGGAHRTKGEKPAVTDDSSQSEMNSPSRPQKKDGTVQEEGGPNRLVVRYANEKGRAEALARGGKVFHEIPGESVLVLELDDDAAEYLDLHDDDIYSVEGDSVWVEQGHLERHLDEDEMQVRRRLGEQVPFGIKMVQADQVSVGSYPVKVCIADTGTARYHPDLRYATIGGTDRYVSSNNILRWSNDSRGHGTHIAGTVSAKHNSVGVVGVGDIPLHITRALDDSGLARESDVFEAVVECAASGSKIISLSLGGGGMSDTFKQYLDKLYDQGFLIVGASGNDNQNTMKWPGSLPSVVSVSAIDEYSRRWENSNWGSWVEATAPGKMILSTSVNDQGSYVYSYYSGTSMATPHYSGVAAILWSHHPQCTNSQIRYAIAVTAKDVNDGTSNGGSGCDEKFGHGLIQARAALDFLNSNPCSQGSWGKEAKDGGCFASGGFTQQNNEGAGSAISKWYKRSGDRGKRQQTTTAADALSGFINGFGSNGGN